MIPTFSGKCLDPFNAKDDLCIEDIAHHLANINRFNGATKRPLSVAQHSVFVARLVGESDNELGLQGLLHDASEAYLGDVTAFLKRTDGFKDYRDMEFLLQTQIYEAFGCSIIEDPLVKEADKLMARYEALRMFGSDFHFCGHKKEYPLVTDEESQRIGCWSPWTWRNAKEIFLAEFERFSNET
jgi:5'-deoxynucleotidase YfbR-like HD superfamily hydrolase